MAYFVIYFVGFHWFFCFGCKLLSVKSNWFAFGRLITKMSTMKKGQYDSQTRSQITL